MEASESIPPQLCLSYTTLKPSLNSGSKNAAVSHLRWADLDDHHLAIKRDQAFAAIYWSLDWCWMSLELRKIEKILIIWSIQAPHWPTFCMAIVCLALGDVWISTTTSLAYKCHEEEEEQLLHGQQHSLVPFHLCTKGKLCISVIYADTTSFCL